MVSKELLNHWIFYSAICATGIVLNIIEIGSLVYTKRTELPFHMTLISLALADLFLSLFSFLVVIILHAVPIPAIPEWFFVVFILVLYSSTISSMLNLLFIAIQRLIAVLYPLQLSVWITRKCCMAILMLLWFTSLAVTAPIFFKPVFSTTLFQYSPSIVGMVMVICYCAINYRMIAKRRMSGARSSSSSPRNKKILLYSICATVLYLISVLPYTIHRAVFPKAAMPFYATSLMYFQTVLDPIVYFLFRYCINCSRMFRGCRSDSVAAQHVERHRTQRNGPVL